VATAEMYPDVSFGAGVGTVGLAGDLFSPKTNSWSFGPLINWTFPVNGQRDRVRAAEAATGGALAHFDGVVLNALRETQSSLATYAADDQRADSLRTAYQSAKQSADETHRLYVAGREAFLSDLDATRTLTSAHAQVAAAEGQVALDQVRLTSLFDGTRCADETFSKPHPAMLQELTRELGQDPVRTVMIGDTTHDLQMAINAGVSGIGVTYGAHPAGSLAALEPKFVADSIASLSGWLREHA